MGWIATIHFLSSSNWHSFTPTINTPNKTRHNRLISKGGGVLSWWWIPYTARICGRSIKIPRDSCFLFCYMVDKEETPITKESRKPVGKVDLKYVCRYFKGKRLHNGYSTKLAFYRIHRQFLRKSGLSLDSLGTITKLPKAPLAQNTGHSPWRHFQGKFTLAV